MNNEFDVPARISQLTKERGWSYYRLAKESGIPQSTLCTILHSPNTPSLSTITKLCNGMEITLAHFFSIGENSLERPLTDAEVECLHSFSSLPPEKRDRVLAYMKGMMD
jgi:transcriptional regulator with XRE-family HTH domain